MLTIPVGLDDIKDDGLDVVAAALFEGVERKYSTDWAVTGPIIAALGISLHYQGDPSDAPKLKSRNIDENDMDWLAVYGDAHQFGSTPLIAAIRAIAVHRLGDEFSLPISHNKVIDYVKDEFTIISPLLHDSEWHDVEPGERIDTYVFKQKEGADGPAAFQDLIALVEKLKGLEILEKHPSSIVVEHV